VSENANQARRCGRRIFVLGKNCLRLAVGGDKFAVW
jgi:hypothetical protein